MPEAGLRGKVAVFAFSAAVTCTFFLNFCGWFYQCGCRSLWAGAADHCNIHNATGRHCPWCSMGQGYWAILASMLAVQCLFSFGFKAFPWSVRLLLSLLAFPVVGLIEGFMIGWFFRY